MVLIRELYRYIKNLANGRGVLASVSRCMRAKSNPQKISGTLSSTQIFTIHFIYYGKLFYNLTIRLYYYTNQSL